MANERQVRWMAGELEALAAGGVIGADVAARVRAHYAATPRNEFPVLGVLGATLVGLGLVLILGHNWEDLASPTRAGISLATLVAAQGLGAFALWRSPESAGWREAAGVVGALCVAAATALIDQTYHVQTSLGVFLWHCALLSLPMILLLRSRGAAVLVLCSAWAVLFSDDFGETAPHRFWLLTGAVSAFVAWLHTQRDPARAAIRDATLGWVTLATILLGATFNFGAHHGMILIVALAATASGLHAFGRTRLEAGDGAFLNAPAARLGGLAVAGLTIAFCFGAAWGIFDDGLDVRLGLGAFAPSVVLALGGSALAVQGARVWLREGQWERALQAALPLVLVLTWFLALALGSSHLLVVSMTAYGLAVGIGTLLAGVRDASAGRANLGLLLVGAVVGVRFLDDEWSFVARGLAFIALGVAFLVLNLRMRRARRGADR